MIQNKIFFDEKDPTGVSYNTPFTVYGSYEGRLWSKTPSGEIKYYTQNSDLSVYATTGSNSFNGNQTVTGSLIVTGGITGSATTASYVEYASVANKPALVSGSAQVSFNGIVDKPTLVSGSSQVSFSGITNKPTLVSSSVQVKEYNVFATTGSNGFNGSQSITGSLTVTGQVIAQTLNVQQVTSSIVYSSGSNVFGNSLANTQQFTGSVGVTGSLTVNGASSFSSNLTATGNLNLQGAVTRNINFYDSSNTNINAQIQYDQISSNSGQLFFGTNNAGTFATRLTISNTGAATFSSSVTATGLIINNNGEALRAYGVSPNVSFYNSANTVRGGYVNHDGSNMNIVANVGGISLTGAATFSSSVQATAMSIGVPPTANILVVKGENATNDGTIQFGARGYLQHRDAGQTITSLANDYNSDAAKIEFRVKGNSTSDAKMTILGSGNVGIGTASPQTNLTIEGTNRAFPLLYNSGYGNIHIQTNETTATQNFGGSLTFGGLGRTSGPTEKFIFAAIAGRKETTSGGDPKGYLQFGTCDDITNEIKERMRITSGGGVGIGTTSITGTTKLRAISIGAVQGDPLFFSDNGIYNAIGLYSAGADGYNGAVTVMIVGRNTTNNRSINAGGTINASGTDYAEYMTKAVEDNISKGDIVGINTEGELTNIFEDSISFVVKSTDPSYVGGDTWGNVDTIGKLQLDATDEQKAEHEAKIEAARAKVDRIAFSGQVPCNVIGASVGDYIIPVEIENGKISGQPVSNPTFEQYQIAVGKVWKIMEDGRAWIAVKIG